MRNLIAMAVLEMLLAACSNPACPDRRDGGIGGTGGCIAAPPQ